MRCFLAAALLTLSSHAFADDPAPPPPPPPPAPPQNVPPALLEGSRISGDKMITPSDVTKTEIQRAGKDKIVGSFKLCIDTAGVPSAVTQLKSTGFSAYDKKITDKMKDWRYKPYKVNGQAVPVCTAVTFIYTQNSAPEPTLRIAAPELLKLRTAGDDKIKPDADTLNVIKQRKLATVTGNFLVCIDDAGDVTHARAVASTGFPSYDLAIASVLDTEWKFKPHMVKGAPTPVCSPVTITFKP